MLTLIILDSKFLASTCNTSKIKGTGKPIFEHCIMPFFSLNDSAYTTHG